VKRVMCAVAGSEADSVSVDGTVEHEPCRETVGELQQAEAIVGEEGVEASVGKESEESVNVEESVTETPASERAWKTEPPLGPAVKEQFEKSRDANQKEPNAVMETVDGMNPDGVAVVSDRNVSSCHDHLFTDDDLEAIEKSDPGQEETILAGAQVW
jgi:hypothetical protein